MNILLTGGAGFIGSNLTKALLKRGDSVVIVDDFNDYYNPGYKRANLEPIRTNSRLKIVEGDIRDGTLLRGLCLETGFETVIHLAARAGVRPSLNQAELYWDVNVSGTQTILEVMREHKIQNLVFASSSSVYGERIEGPFKETDNTDFQVSPYGASKKAMEVLVAPYTKLFGIKATGLRFFTVYGPGNRPDMACWLFMKAIDSGETLTMFGDGTSGRDYTYIDDIVSGIIAAVDNPQSYEIINLGNQSPILLKDMIVTFERVIGKKAKIKSQPRQPGDVSLTFADTTKAKKLLNWQAKTSFKAGVEQLYHWYQQTKHNQEKSR